MKNLLFILAILLIYLQNINAQISIGPECHNTGRQTTIVKFGNKNGANYKRPSFKKGSSNDQIEEITSKELLPFTIDSFLIEGEKQKVNIKTESVKIGENYYFLTSVREKGNFFSLGEEADFVIYNQIPEKGFRILNTKTFFLIITNSEKEKKECKEF